MFRLLALLIAVLLITSSFSISTAQDVTPIAPVATEVPMGNLIPYQKGISVVLYGNDSTMQGNTVRFFDDLDQRNLGVDSIIFTFPIFQDGTISTTLYEDPALTPSLENIRIYIQEAHLRGYTIWLKPLIDDQRTGAWRGAIAPGGNFNLTALDAWFASYGELMLRYAQLAEEENILGLVIGAEMESMDKPVDKYTIRWNALIASLRIVYGGNLSYAKNWTPIALNELPGFSTSLDILMIDAFFNLQNISYAASAEEIYIAWQQWLPALRSYYTTLGIPIMFAEVGVIPRSGSFFTPWNGNNGGPLNYQAQVVYYQGTCQFLREFGESFGFRGPYWWAVGFYDNFENQRVRAEEEGVITYNFYDLPAEETLRQCYSG